MQKTTEEKQNTDVLKILKKVFEYEKLLLEPEDLYVYKHINQFGLKTQKNPIAVLCIKTKSEETLILNLIKDKEIGIRFNDKIDETSFDEDQAYIIVDSRQPTSIKELESRLKIQRESNQKMRKELKVSSSFLHWMTKSLHTNNGYKVAEKNNNDAGFCVVSPFLNNLETFSSKGRLLLAKGFIKGDLTSSERLVKSIYSCTACGQCYDEISPETLEINNVIIKTRYELTKQGYSPNFYQSLQKNIQKEGNPFGMPQEDRVLWYEDTADEFRYSSNKSLFWPGCNTSYRLPEIVESTSNIFSKASLDFGILGNNESCCGLIFYLMGYWEKAKECAEKILNQLKEDTPENIITSCAGCFYAFKKVYKSLGINLPFNVLHTSQIFEKILSNERFSIKPLRKTILWHDPCDLGRHCNVYDPPRKVLRNIPEMKLIEPFLTKQHNVCCGAGGGLWMYDEKLTINVSHQKLIETVPSNLDSIVTGCPSCILNLRNAARQIRKNLQIFDLSEILDNCLK